MKKNRGTIFLILVFLVGLSVMLYPTISDYVNQRHSSQAVASYDKAVNDLTDVDYSAYFVAADEFNLDLAEMDDPITFMPYNEEMLEKYYDTLDITGTGVMGYITIEKIGVELPIYHGTDEGVLAAAAGHLVGTSLPVGGQGTHAVISAHRGLPSAKLFTNLDELEVGDTFTITVLDRILTYEVDQISIVLPNELENLYIEEGQDYVTLLTCTPYGINSHRLLVRGHWVETPEAAKHIRVTADAFQIEPIIVAPVLAVPMLLALLIWLIISSYRSAKRAKQARGENHENP